MKKKHKQEKKAFIKTKVKPNNSIEVEIQKNPAQTLVGKIFLFVIVGGMTLLGLVALIMLIIEVSGNI